MGRTLIVVGDINSSPGDPIVPGSPPLPPLIVPPYQQFIAAGYIDIWTLGPPADGFTCCQLPNLFNMTSLLDERIDMIFALTAPSGIADVAVVGDQVSDKTPPPGFRLWPSDHGGVVADMEF